MSAIAASSPSFHEDSCTNSSPGTLTAHRSTGMTSQFTTTRNDWIENNRFAKPTNLSITCNELEKIDLENKEYDLDATR